MSVPGKVTRPRALALLLVSWACSVAEAQVATRPASTQPTAATAPTTRPIDRDLPAGPLSVRPGATEQASTGAVSGPMLAFDRLFLPNGVEALLLRDRATPMLGVFAIVRAGLAMERPGEDGLSHFLEHLLFNGTNRLSQEELYAAVDALGGYSNATTRRDHTLFQMLVPQRHLEVALDLHVQMLFQSTVPVEKFEKERGIVLEEIARDSTQSATLLDDAFRRLAWAGTALARPVIGSPETLRTIGRDAVVAYWRRTYVPRNVVVLVVGDCEVERFRQAVTKAYGGIADSSGDSTHRDGRMPVPTATTLTTLRLEDSKDSPLRVMLGWPGPESTHPDTTALDVLASILSHDSGSGLTQSLAAAGITAIETSVALERASGATALMVHISAPSGTDPRRLTELTASAVRNLGRSVDAKTLAAFHLRQSLDAASLAERPHYFGIEKSAMLVNGGSGAVEGESSAIASVSPAMLAATAARWLDAPFTALAGGPGLQPSTIVVDATAVDPTSTSRSSSRTATTRLANGLTLHVQSNPGAAILAIHVLIRGRGPVSPETGAGFSGLVMRLLPALPGVKDALEGIGGRLKTADDPSIPYDDYYSVPDYGYIRLETLDTFGTEAVALLVTLLTASDHLDSVDSQTRRRVLAGLLSAADRDRTSPGTRSRQLLAEALFGASHPLAAPLHEVTADRLSADNQRREESPLSRFTRTYLDPTNVIVTVQTGQSSELVTSRLATALGALTSAAAQPIAFPAAPTAGDSRQETLSKSQSYVRMGRSVRIAPADRAAAELAIAVLSERLAMDIRERRGMAYSIGASLELRGTSGPDTWIASAGTRPENIDEVARAVREILADLSANGPTEKEARLAATRAQGRSLMRRLSAMGRAWADGVDLFIGDQPGASLTRTESLDGVPLAAVQQAIERYLQPEEASVAIIR